MDTEREQKIKEERKREKNRNTQISLDNDYPDIVKSCSLPNKSLVGYREKREKGKYFPNIQTS